MVDTLDVELPGLDCGLCGYRTCVELRERLVTAPEILALHPSFQKSPENRRDGDGLRGAREMRDAAAMSNASGGQARPLARDAQRLGTPTWKDSLDREFDFYLEH